MKSRITKKRDAAISGFSMLELLMALGILLFGVLMVLAVIMAKAREENDIIEEHTASLAIASVVHAVDTAFATPIRTDYVEGVGPRIRIDHPGMFTGEVIDRPEGYAIIDLPGIPSDPMILPPDVPVARYPEEEGKTYLLGEYLATDEEQQEPGNPSGKVAARHVDVMSQYSFALKIRNWRGSFRLSVPLVGDPDYEAYSKTPSARRLSRFWPYNPQTGSGHPSDAIETGGNSGYEVTVEVYRNYRPTTQEEIAAGMENATLVARERFIRDVDLGFGSR